MIRTATFLRRLRHDERGFTLIELTATMAILSIFLAAVALVLSGAISKQQPGRGSVVVPVGDSGRARRVHR